MTNIIIIGVAILVCINSIATWNVIRSASTDKSQKIVQIALIWIIPLIGAVVIYSFHKSEAVAENSNKIPGEGVCGAKTNDSFGDSGGDGD